MAVHDRVENAFLEDMTEDKDFDTLTLFHTSKELFVNDVRKLETFTPQNFHEMKGLLADHDGTVVQLAMNTMTDAVVRFGKEAADMFLEIGIPAMALSRGKDRFTNIPFYPALKFISNFARFHPEWICENIDEIQTFLALTFVGNEPNFIFCSFDIIDVICDFKCEILLEDSCNILLELLKVLATEKVKAVVPEEKGYTSYAWQSLFSVQPIEAEPMDKHVFLRCLKSLTVICDKLSKFQTDKIRLFFKKLCDLLGKNSMKVINPDGCLHLLNIITEHHPPIAEYLCQKGIIATIKSGLTYENISVREECKILLNRIKPFDAQIQAYELLIDAVRLQTDQAGQSAEVEEENNQEEIYLKSIQKYISPISAIAHAAQDADASIILIALGGTKALIELTKIQNKDIQKSCLDAIVKMCTHSYIHANTSGEQGMLSKILKIDLASQEADLIRALADSFTQILSKTTHVMVVVECFYVCRYETGRKAIKQHLLTLFGRKKSSLYKKLMDIVKEIDVKDTKAIKEFTKKMKTESDEL